MFTSKSVLLSMIISALLLLSACGGDDADTAVEESMDSAMDMEKAEGVIYQDEIYANWPYN
ncbi:MAG TPA: hypothetical protein EYQ42_08570 [Thiotrichaceae bacterium]|jgi:hypothetical protein|nr:hypothetical protein [Thiotrichaceae bacterium]HIM07313.1 hypothetical protein [Gammaproteobacteria bacterium]